MLNELGQSAISQTNGIPLAGAGLLQYQTPQPQQLTLASLMLCSKLLSSGYRHGDGPQ
jgi:hypothetical protein